MRALRLRTARGSTSRGGARALVQLRRELAAGRAGGLHRRRPARAGASGAARRRLAGRRDRPSDPAVSHRSRPLLDGEELGPAQVPKPFSTVAVVLGEPIEVSGEGESATESARTRFSARSRVSKRALAAGCWGPKDLPALVARSDPELNLRILGLTNLVPARHSLSNETKVIYRGD